MSALYPSLLGASWTELAPPVRAIHAGGAQVRGRFRVRRGQGLFARLLGAILRLPPAAEAIAITLAVETVEGVERWVRTFGERPLHTVQWRRDEWLVEGLGLVQCWFRLRAEGGALIFEQGRATFGVRGFSVPLPRWLAPRIEGRAEPRGDDAHVDVRIHAPIAGLLVAYDGHVTPVTSSMTSPSTSPSTSAGASNESEERS